MRLKMGVGILASVAAFATFVIWDSNRALSKSYSSVGRAEVLAIARTFQVDFVEASNAARAQALVDRLQELNPTLRKVSLYVVRSGHGRRLASTDRADLRSPVEAHDVEPSASAASTSPS